MKKLSVLFIAITALIFSCSKEDISKNKTEIPEGWELERQIAVINGQGYFVDLIYNKETKESKYINEPNEAIEFFNE